MRVKSEYADDLTGCVRARRGWFGGLILQVETFDGWRDAQTEDLAAIRLHGFVHGLSSARRITQRHPVLQAMDRVDE
jgi:hypothetical protein